MRDTTINVPSSSSQASTEDTNTGNTSPEGGEMAKNVGAANADVIVMPFKQSFDGIRICNPGDGSRDISAGIGNLKAGDLNTVSDLLDESNKYV
jgi:hypothetical protein